jgi:Protein of unknown function (DUF2478)
MNFAYVTIAGRGSIDDCISEAVTLLERRGLRLTGTVRAFPVNHHAHACDMDIRILPNGPLVRISQALGVGSRGCRLDPGSIEKMSTEVESRLEGSQLLVVNKFGKQECIGRGLRAAIARALDLELPILVGVNLLNLPDFHAFACGHAREIDGSPESILCRAGKAIRTVEAAVV